MKFWILPNCDEYEDEELRKTLIDAGVKIGKEEDTYGGIRFRQCEIPETTWKTLDNLWLRMYVWGLENDEEDSQSDS